MKRIIIWIIAITTLLSLSVAFSSSDGSENTSEDATNETEEATRISISGRPSGITVTKDGKLLVTDIWEMAVWEIDGDKTKKLTKNGTQDLLGKVIGDMEDGSISSAMFSTPFDIVPYNDGYAVSDTNNHLIRFISSNMKTVTTIAGSGTAGLKDDKNTSAEFNRPTGLASDSSGNLYIADTNNNAIRKMDKNGNITTLAGGSEGTAVGGLNKTEFNMPTGLCWYEDKLYVADSGNHRIVVIEGEKSSVLTGGVKDPDDEEELNGGAYRNGSLEMAAFSNPQGILATEEGIYISDSGNSAVRLIKDDLVSTPDNPSVLSPRGMVFVDDELYVCDVNTNHITQFATDHKKTSFTDIKSDSTWYDAAINAYRYGIFIGVSEDSFAPEGDMTRAQYITALGNMHSFLFPDDIIIGESEAFDDVPEDAYYSAPVYWGRANGVTEGTGENMFSPDMKITRETVAVFLYNYAKITNFNTSGSDIVALEEFPDSTEISAWAAEAMAWAVDSGIFITEEDGSLNPRANAVRGWTAEMFLNFIKLKN